MGLYDRDYTQADSNYHYRHAPQMRMSFFWCPPIVKRLLLINTAVFVVCAIIPAVRDFLYTWFSVYSSILGMCLQPWRLVTYQFLHDANGFGHIFGNMLGLFFFGRMLERLWGSRKFLIFYLVCGAIGGAIYPLLVWAGFLMEGFLIGASGAVFGVIAAVAILFPRVLVYIWGVFPIPMVVLALIYLLISIILLFDGDNAGGQVAHLAGMATGALYVLYQPWRQRLKQKMQAGTWQRKASEQYDLQVELDRILQKVHDFGIHSLNSREKKILKQATKAQQMRNK